MATYASPRRTTSIPNSITVTGTLTALQAAANAARDAAAANPLGTGAFYSFKGLKSGAVTGSLDLRVPHPSNPSVSCDPTENGQDVGKPAIDWAASGCYDDGNGDPTKRRVMWMGSGANTAVGGGYVWSMLTVYDETTDTWTCERGFRPPNSGINEGGIGHLYGSNFIHPINRKLHKGHIDGGVYYTYNLDTNTHENKVNFTCSGSQATNGESSFAWIPTRNRIWFRHVRGSNSRAMLWEANTAGTTFTQLFASDTTFVDTHRTPLIFNPRAFGGVGGVFMGGVDEVSVETPTGTLSTSHIHYNTTGMPSGSPCWSWPIHDRVAASPTEDGWYYMNPLDGYIWYLSSGSAGAGNSGTWTQKAQLPVEIRNRYASNGTFNFVMVTLPESYGCIWIIGNNFSANRAWLYHP